MEEVSVCTVRIMESFWPEMGQGENSLEGRYRLLIFRFVYLKLKI